VLGTGRAAGTVNVIDFGLARRFRDPRTGAHVPYAQADAHGTGTSLFASLNTHDGIGLCVDKYEEPVILTSIQSVRAGTTSRRSRTC
jgi:hypothetical protein